MNYNRDAKFMPTDPTSGLKSGSVSLLMCSADVTVPGRFLASKRPGRFGVEQPTSEIGVHVTPGEIIHLLLEMRCTL